MVIYLVSFYELSTLPPPLPSVAIVAKNIIEMVMDKAVRLETVVIPFSRNKEL